LNSLIFSKWFSPSNQLKQFGLCYLAQDAPWPHSSSRGKCGNVPIGASLRRALRYTLVARTPTGYILTVIFLAALVIALAFANPPPPQPPRVECGGCVRSHTHNRRGGAKEDRPLPGTPAQQSGRSASAGRSRGSEQPPPKQLHLVRPLAIVANHRSRREHRRARGNRRPPRWRFRHPVLKRLLHGGRPAPIDRISPSSF
jgi:hypothetical protein